MSEMTGSLPVGSAPVGPPSRPSNRWLFWHRWPLRRRLIAGLLLVLLPVLVGAGAVTTFALRNYLVNQLDGRLAQAGDRIQVRASGSLEGLDVGTLFAPMTSSGSLVSSPLLITNGRDVGAQPSLSATDVTLLAAATTTPSMVFLSELGDYRILAVPGDRLGERHVIGLPMDGVLDTLRELLWVQGAAAALALIVVISLGSLLVRRTLAPLERVAATARLVAERPLSSGPAVLPDRVAVEAPEGTEVGDLAIAVNEMLDHVQTSLSVRDVTEQRLRRFVADASHELRTPLASIRGYAELLRRLPAHAPATEGSWPELTSLDADRSNAARRIEAEAARLGVLVDDLLTLARLDQGRPLRQDPVDLTRLVSEVAADARMGFPDRSIRLEVPAQPCVVAGDADRLRQVMLNLLTNVAVHTPVGTLATVSLRPAPGPLAADGSRVPGSVSVLVVDNGPGISPDVVDRVFERFARGDSASRSRTSGGSGLGLSIVEAIAMAHHGDVSVASGTAGTTVTLTLPMIGLPEPD